MFDVALILAFIFLVIAGIWDLKTTEVPDEIPLLMSSLGLFLWTISSLTSGDFSIFMLSFFTGLALLSVGYIFYKTGQWGGADATLLGSVGFLLPTYPTMQFFPIDFFINLFLVGSVYMIFYSIIIGLKNSHLFSHFLKDLKENIIVVFISMTFLISGIMLKFQVLQKLLLLLGFLMLFWRYAMVLEKNFFVKRIPVSKLKPGDVIADSKKWVGLTEKEVEDIRRKRKTVKIKEGIRFVPAFPITLVVTVVYGNLMFLLL
jgi:Flp pilus assembly protein protease CpaA